MTATQSRAPDESPHSEAALITAYERRFPETGRTDAQRLDLALRMYAKGDLTDDYIRGAERAKQRSDQIRIYDLTNADDLHDWNAGSRLARAKARPSRIASHGHARAARCSAVRTTGSRRTTTASRSSSSDDPGGDTDPGDLAGDHSLGSLEPATYVTQTLPATEAGLDAGGFPPCLLASLPELASVVARGWR